MKKFFVIVVVFSIFMSILNVYPAYSELNLPLTMPPILAAAKYDRVPNSFTFVDRTNVDLNTVITSNTITVSGIDISIPISITGGSYSINGAAFTSEPSTIENGQSVQVQVTSSSNYSTSVSAKLNIGGVSDTFIVTTEAMPAGVYVLGNHTSFINSIDYIHVVGEVFNNTLSALRFVKITANFFSSTGQLRGSDYTYTWLDNLPPGEKTCFELSIDNPGGVSYFSFEPVSYRSDGTVVPGLSIYNHSDSSDSTFGWYEIIGMVQNNSGSTITFVSPVGTLYNASEKVIGCDFTYVNSTDLAAGQSSSFEMTFLGRDYSDVASYRLQVDGN